jgi:hypothetical protein
MRRVSVGCETRRFQLPTQGSLQEEGKVVIPSASSLSITFHQTGAEVELASNEDFCNHHKTFSSSTNPQKELTHLVPGNTVYYRVSLEAAREGRPPCFSLTVTGTQMGRFTTGLRFLLQLLTEAESGEGEVQATCVPVSQLWPNLIAVACHATGQDRLKVIRLLLQLLALTTEGPAGERPDLSALRPLWQLYTTLVKDYGAHHHLHLSPSISLLCPHREQQQVPAACGSSHPQSSH